MHTHAHTYVYTYTHALRVTHKRTHRHTHRRTHRHAHIHTNIRTHAELRDDGVWMCKVRYLTEKHELCNGRKKAFNYYSDHYTLTDWWIDDAGLKNEIKLLDIQAEIHMTLKKGSKRKDFQGEFVNPDSWRLSLVQGNRRKAETAAARFAGTHTHTHTH